MRKGVECVRCMFGMPVGRYISKYIARRNLYAKKSVSTGESTFVAARHGLITVNAS